MRRACRHHEIVQIETQIHLEDGPRGTESLALMQGTAAAEAFFAPTAQLHRPPNGKDFPRPLRI